MNAARVASVGLVLTIVGWTALRFQAVSEEAPYFDATPLPQEGRLAGLKFVARRAIPSFIPFPDAPARKVSLSVFNDSVSATAGELGGTAHQVAHDIRSTKSVAVVFVPGIPGSRLIMRDGTAERLLWDQRKGDDESGGDENTNEFFGGGRVNATELALPIKYATGGHDPRVFTKLLDAYKVPVFDDADIYGGIDTRLNEIVSNFGPLVVFSYDWRLDARTNARLLDDCLRGRSEGNRLDDSRCSDLAQHDVILVGHSMGGLIVWAWQQEYAVNDAGPVRQLALLAAPLHGSCEMFRTLLHGYELSPTDPKLKKLGARVLLGNRLRSAAFTFPGALEVLPVVPQGPEDACLEEPLGGGTNTASNYFRLVWWRKGIGSRLIGKPWDELKTDPDPFFDHFGKALDTARKFREWLDPSRSNLPVTYFYSRHFATPGKALALPHPKRRFVARFEVAPAGDGRVTRDSVRQLQAQLAAAELGTNKAAFVECSLRHGRLPEDDHFTLWLGRRLLLASQASMTRRFTALLKTDSRFLATYRRLSPLVPDLKQVEQGLGSRPKDEVAFVWTALDAEARPF